MTGNDDTDKGVCLVLFVVKRLYSTYLPIHGPKMLVANNHYAVHPTSISRRMLIGTCRELKGECFRS